MKVLLVNPWIYDFAAFDLWVKPLGLLYIADALRKLGCEVQLIDCLDRNYPGLIPKGSIRTEIKNEQWGCGKYHKEEAEKPETLKHIPRKYKRYGIPVPLFEEELKDKNPDVILISSGMTYWYPGVFKVIEILKKRLPGIPMLLGGIYATLCAEHAKKYSGAEVFAGGDIGKAIKESFRLKGEKINQEICDIKSLRPAYDLYNKPEYAAIRTSWGCPLRCSYCAIRLLSRRFEQRDCTDVLSEIEFFNEKQGIKNFAFYDDALLFNAEKHIVKILEGIIKRKTNCYFHTPNGIHARYMTDKTACLMRQANFVQPRLSLETTNEKRQKATGAKVTNKEFIAAVKNLQKAGYKPDEIYAYILMGMPGQDFKEVEESIKFASNFGTKVFLVEYSPIPGTRDWREHKFDFKDPLLHNNSIFPLHDVKDWDKFQKLKDFARELNAKVST